MSLKETYSLAHTARCKLQLSVDRPDRNLRFVVGHAMHLDSLMLRIVEIEESVQQPQHASAVKFRGTPASGSTGALPRLPRTMAKRSPPPRAEELDSDEDEDEDEDVEDDGDEEDLGLTRFPSGSAAPPRHAQHTPQLIPSDGDSSSSSDDDDDGDGDGLAGRDPESFRDIINGNSNGDQFLAELYNDVKNCPCHKSDAPKIERAWEIPGEEGGKRMAVVEVAA
jgi:hypothetical protein